MLSCRPPVGNQPNRSANTYFSRNARKNTGMATPRSEVSTLRLSSKVPLRRAAK